MTLDLGPGKLDILRLQHKLRLFEYIDQHLENDEKLGSR